MEFLRDGFVLLQLEVEDGEVMGIVEAIRPVAFVFIDEALVIRILAGDLGGLFDESGCGIEVLILGRDPVVAQNFRDLIGAGRSHVIRELLEDGQQVIGMNPALAILQQLGEGGDVKRLDVALGAKQQVAEMGEYRVAGGDIGLALPVGKKVADADGEVPGGRHHVLVIAPGFRQLVGGFADRGDFLAELVG